MRRLSLQSKSNILFEATRNETLCMTWLPTVRKTIALVNYEPVRQLKHKNEYLIVK